MRFPPRAMGLLCLVHTDKGTRDTENVKLIVCFRCSIAHARFFRSSAQLRCVRLHAESGARQQFSGEHLLSQFNEYPLIVLTLWRERFRKNHCD